MRYFDHDTRASDDDAILALRLEHGGAAVDCYWTLLEKMYRDEAPLNLFGSNMETNMETKSVLHRLCIDENTLKTYVSTMVQLGLFEGDVENLISRRAMQNIEAYHARQETARQNGKKGGRKPTRKPKANQVGLKAITNAETNSQPRSLQEKKRKDIGSNYKLEPISIDAVSGADADKPAPLTAHCMLCESELTKTGMKDPEYWFCDSCKSFFPKLKVSA